MRLGQISSIHFVSNLVASVLGFIATIYIARVLGAEPLGIYHLSLGLISWLAIVGTMGFSGAISKRISEGEEQGAYAIAGFSINTGLFLLIAIALVIARPYVNDYVGYSVTGYVILILLVVLGFSVVNDLLRGLHLVHMYGVLIPVKVGSRSLLQILLALSGFGVASLFIGHIAGIALVLSIGLYIVSRNLPTISRPKIRHFKSLFDFAKFSWLGSLRGQMFAYMDVIVLGFFVSQSLIGIYSVSWSIAQFLSIFSDSITDTIFPEMSRLSTKENPEAVSRMVEQSIMYSGLFLIPGLFGGALLGERILQIYGPEFRQGATILTILIGANLIHGYQKQLLNTLNGIDRPDLAFRVNSIFVTTNLILNIILVYLYGWVGAAVATATSVGISYVFAHKISSSFIDFVFPKKEIMYQILSALVMIGVVYGGIRSENTYKVLQHNFALVMVLVIIGAGVYFIVLLTLSEKFRETVGRNLPIEFASRL